MTPRAALLAAAAAVALILLADVARADGGDDCGAAGDDAGAEGDHARARTLKIAAFFSILVCGGLGCLLPVLGRRVPALRPEGDVFFLIKAFAAGVILATGFIHILPDAFEKLSSPCLAASPWQEFPFAGFGAMVGAIGTLIVDTLATGYFTRVHFNQTAGATGSSASTAVTVADVEKQQGVLELGIVVHSVIIGISLGASNDPSTIKPLVVALSFHQMFEGMGLGGCIVQAKFKLRSIVTMVLFFCLTTPVGILVGIGISKGYNDNSPTALIIEGLLNSVAAGILIYMALVDLLAEDFMNPKVQSRGKLQLGINVSMLIGAGLMSMLAKWA
ncbi:hypothetical protein PR202_gb12682 [Eleusine coracana subsp. coracana]|uniref:Uncharacterized protein n=1 Tax=Eleusine coracana subsp. coracana TaxID=191504 RepID=A0AAV5EQN1_ELECO|nr:hypothetical protein PR202_gb12682 [Eleusine coracana subsp. coracana]